MRLKSLIIVIIVSILIGVGIFFFTNQPSSSLETPKKSFFSLSKPVQTPTPKPTLPPLDENSNLTEELEKTTPPDFSEDIKHLKETLN